jgi:transcriptional regulator with XRE-family HTH domain
MLTETLTSGLQRYQIGPKVRALRLKKKLGLAQLSEHTGLSPAMLSKIERGQLFPTLPTLLRIAMVFGVGLEHFFLTEESRRAIAVVRGKDRLRLPNRPGKQPPAYTFESLNFPAADPAMDAFFAEFPANSKPSEPHHHDGEEFIFVFSGALKVNVDGNDIDLLAGDAMYFDSSAPHSYCAAGLSPCSAVVVVAT